jgi:hypothetical protein
MRTSVVVVAALLANGCEKAGPDASGKLTDEESELMSRLPSDASIAFGGNLPRLQKQLAESPVMRLARLGNDTFQGQNEWQDCLGDKPFKHMLGTVDVRSGFELRFVMTGLEMSDLVECAKKAKLPYQLDADNKFIAIEIKSPEFSTKLPYLVLDDGAIYAKYSIGLSPGSSTPKFNDSGRPRMEADLVDAKKTNATDNKALLATMEKADRKKGMWFAGSAKGTLIGDYVHEMYGTLDLEGGLTMDVSVEMADSKTANKVLDSIDQARDAGGLLGKEVKSVLDAIKTKRDGDRIRFRLEVSNAQLDAVFAKLGSMGMTPKPSRSRPLLEDEN